MPENPERSAFEELVRRHHAAVYRAAMRVLGDEEQARDATQEVFLGLLRQRRAGAASSGGLPAGVRDAEAVLRHRGVQRALSRLSAEGHRRRREESVAMERAEAFEEHRVEQDEARDLVGRLLARLPDDLRAALSLRFGEDLTYAAIAELTGCSEPTAHERVRRGLERLRGELGRAGFAGLAPGLPGLLAGLEPPAVPAGLEQALLGLAVAKPALSFLAASAWVAAGLASVVLVGNALVPRWLGAGGDSAPPPPLAHLAEPAGASAADPEPDPAARPQVDPRATGPGADGRHALGPAATHPPPAGASPGVARVRGTIADEFGRPLADAEVLLLASQTGLKAPFPAVRARSGANGAFELEVEPGDHPYLLSARASGRLEHTSHPFGLGRGAVRHLGLLHLLPDSADTPGEFTLVLYLVDRDGLPAPDALVVLERRARAFDHDLGAARAEPDGDGVPWNWLREDSRRTDAAGRIELAGNLLGIKRARIAPARGPRLGPGPAELAPALEAFEIGRPGRHERVIELAPGLAIEGRLATVDGSPVPVPSVVPNAVVAVGPPAQTWYPGELRADGSFRIGGLLAAPHQVRIAPHGLSPLTLEEVLPDGEPLDLLLKRADDPRAVGRHDAELHAVAYDARSGAPVAVHPHDVLCEQLWGEELGLNPRELVERRRSHPRQYQRALSGPEPAPSPHIHQVGLQPGTYALWVEAPGYAHTLAGIHELGRGELVAGIRVLLEPLASQGR